MKHSLPISDRLAVACLALLLVTPALVARLHVPGLPLYGLGFAGFVFVCGLRNLAETEGLYSRLAWATPFLLLICAVTFSFAVGGGTELRLYAVVVFNCVLGIAVAVYPWDRASLTWLMRCCVGFAIVLSVAILTYAGSDEAIRRAIDDDGRGVIRGYLTISLIVGFGCLAAMYLVIERLSLIGLGVLFLVWVGLALGQGRSTFMLCVLLAAVYGIAALSSNLATFRKGRKTLIVMALIPIVPAITTILFSLERNRQRFGAMFADVGGALDESNRTLLKDAAMRKIGESPLFGNGLGEYMLDEGGTPHNVVLQYAVDGGIVAGALLIAFLLTLLYIGMLSVARSGAHLRNVSLVVLMFFLYQVTNMLVSIDAYVARAFFIVAGLQIGIARFVILQRSSKWESQVVRYRSRMVLVSPDKLPGSLRSSGGGSVEEL